MCVRIAPEVLWLWQNWLCSGSWCRHIRVQVPSATLVGDKQILKCRLSSRRHMLSGCCSFGNSRFLHTQIRMTNRMIPNMNKNIRHANNSILRGIMIFRLRIKIYITCIFIYMACIFSCPPAKRADETVHCNALPRGFNWIFRF